jgi:DNA polymerase III epsilon subunit-like protein
VKFLIDFETANLKDRCPIQVGLIVVNNKLETSYEFESLIKPYPAAVWDEGAERVHGIKQSELEDAPSIEQVGLMLAGVFKCYESWVHPNEIVFHAQGNFDIEILNNLMMMAGLFGQGMPLKWCTYNTLKEARKHKLFDKYSLSYIMAKLEFEYQAHDALSDCKAMLRLMKEINKYE